MHTLYMHVHTDEIILKIVGPEQIFVTINKTWE